MCVPTCAIVPWQVWRTLIQEQVAEVVAPHPDTLDLVSSWLKHWGIPSSSVSTALGGNWLKVVGVSVPSQRYPRRILLAPRGPARAHTSDRADDTLRLSARGGMRLQMHPSAGIEAREKDGAVKPRRIRRAVVPALAVQDRGLRSQSDGPERTRDYRFRRATGEDASFDVVQINGGGYDPNKPGLEGSLDIQYAEAMAYPTPHIYYSTDGTPESLTDDPYIRWLDYLLDEDNDDIPQTISTSYGGYEHIASLEYATKVCDLFSQLGARGVSVLFASGDYGVGDGDCLVRDGSGNTYYQFLPFFPASCPWVTSVGGTTSHDPEVAASLSGGGFSIYFDRPEYQEGVIPTFLQHLGDTYEGFYDPNGRGYPDISAQAVGLAIVLGGKIEHVEGTSGSTPTVAGIISLLNDYLISRGSQPLGFLNPWLYGTGRPGLNDITSGSNPGCGTN
ncbi:subtilisin-like protein, partial [Lactarius hatsudake]